MLISRRTVVEIIILLKTARRTVHSGGGREKEGPIIVRSKDGVIGEVDGGAWKYSDGGDGGEGYVCEAG